MRASTWLDYHQRRPSAPKNSFNKLHMARYQVILTTTIIRPTGRVLQKPEHVDRTAVEKSPPMSASLRPTEFHMLAKMHHDETDEKPVQHTVHTYIHDNRLYQTYSSRPVFQTYIHDNHLCQTYSSRPVFHPVSAFSSVVCAYAFRTWSTMASVHSRGETEFPNVDFSRTRTTRQNGYCLERAPRTAGKTRTRRQTHRVSYADVNDFLEPSVFVVVVFVVVGETLSPVRAIRTHALSQCERQSLCGWTRLIYGIYGPRTTGACVQLREVT
jgi:hypothetical protein